MGEGVSVQNKESPYRVQVLERALGILEILSSQDSGLTLIDLSEHLDLHKSTAHRLLMVLERHRFVERGEHDGKYRLGMKLFELGSRAVAHLDLRGRAQPHLEQLVFETGETAHLCILDHDEALCIEKVEPPQAVRAPTSVGQRHPAHCTAVGKILLAFLPEGELDDLIKRRGLRAYTRSTITTPAQLKKELQRIRQLGYATDNEEIEEWLRCVGAPVRDYSSEVVASLSIAGPSFRLTEDKVPVLANAVIKAANELSAELGYQGARPEGSGDNSDQGQTED